MLPADPVSFSGIKIFFRILLLLCCFAGFVSGSGCGKQQRQDTVSVIPDLNDPQYMIGGMTGIVATREARAKLPHAKFLEYSMPIDAFTALCAGKINAVVLDRPTLEFMSLAHPELTVMKEDLAIGHISVAAAKRNTVLIREVNGFIRKYRADGTYQEMYNRWFRSGDPVMPPVPQPGPMARELKIGITANNEPMCFIQNGDLAGFDSEFSLRLSRALGCKAEFKDIPYDALPAALESGRIDLAIAQMDVLPEREESLLFSDNYIDSPITFLLPKMIYADTAMTGSEKNASSLAESFYKTFLRESRWEMILQGLGTTLVITFFSVLLGTILAFPVCQMCRSRNPLTAWISNRCVNLIMGTPILVILMIFYYVIFAKVDISGVLVAVLAFGIDFAAYTSVTLRSGINGIPKGQMEAALALGYRPSAAFIRFILPQAVRTILPVYRGQVISTLKATSVVGYIAITDLTKMGDIIRSRTYEAFFPLIAIAVIYFLAAKGLTSVLMIAENKLNPDCRRKRLQKRGIR